MALFGSLSEKLSHVFSKLTKRGVLTELEIKNAMREIRIALLEADVNFLVVKDLVSKISEKCSGERVLKSLTPGQQVVKIVNEELTALMGGTNSKLTIASKPPTIILMCGLQGAGKTTMCGKLAKLLKKQGKKPMLVACDIYRPAAINQLKVVGKSVEVEVYEEGTNKPEKTALNSLKYAENKGYDVVIIDNLSNSKANVVDKVEEITGKRVKLTEFELTSRGRKGVQVIRDVKTNPYYIINAFNLNSKSLVGLKTLDENIVLKASELPIVDRYSTGSQLTKQIIETAYIVSDITKAEDVEEIEEIMKKNKFVLLFFICLPLFL